MRLWTYHPNGFRIDNPELAIDPTQGTYWNEPLTPRYKEALPRLCKMLGLDEYPLWCFTSAGCWVPVENQPVVEWELSVSDSQILGFVRTHPWDSIVKGQGDDWETVIVKERPVLPDQYVSALVPLPLSPAWEPVRRGWVVSPLWVKEAMFLKSRPNLQLENLKKYHDRAADPKRNAYEHKVDAGRVAYLEDFLGLKPQE
jgi:hypothetical protein